MDRQGHIIENPANTERLDIENDRCIRSNRYRIREHVGDVAARHETDEFSSGCIGNAQPGSHGLAILDNRDAVTDLADLFEAM